MVKGECQTKNQGDYASDGEEEKEVRALDEDDIALLKTYGLGPYTNPIKDLEKDISKMNKKVNDIRGVKESDTGLAPPSMWDVTQDKEMMQSVHKNPECWAGGCQVHDQCQADCKVCGRPRRQGGTN
jgi:hypothetical protein